MKGIEDWQPDQVISKYAPQMLHETVANELDPNLIVIRLGPTLSKERMSDKSSPVNSVNDGDTFAVSFHRNDFSKKRDA